MAYNHKDVEKKWNKFWDESGIYSRKNMSSANGKVDNFVVDTPPPTVSGSLHIGHVFSYTQTDIQVRYRRMRGYNIFYPLGWDDNGLPTERRVQNYFGIKCNPHVEYDANWVAEHIDGNEKQFKEISRENFIQACLSLVKDDEKIFEDLFKSIGHSYDWSMKYSTMNCHCRRISQLSFLKMIKQGVIYNKEMPVMWDTTFNSAIAQAEIEDRQISGKFYDINFSVVGGEKFTISTTRPELLPACIAIVAHPDDVRYQHMFGKYAITPGFYAKVPILASEHAIAEKGTGIMMVCTFGDINDVNWWKNSNLPCKQIFSKTGIILDVCYGNGVFSCEDVAGVENYNKLIGLNLKKAREIIINILTENGSLLESRDIVHAVKFYEKGDRPIEFIQSRQWFVDILNYKKEFIEQGRKINWHPSYMLSRYENWVDGLAQDWCISRQRFFGVPFPVWYKIDQYGNVDYSSPILAEEDMLPVDPSVQVPLGYSKEDRGVAGGFVEEIDVMDTWATSSLTPQITSFWGQDDDMHDGLFPFDLRPQSHDIIRTWAFYTIVKSYFHSKQIPWKNIAVSGFIVDSDRKKMSKSKGNVITPGSLIDQYSADAVRYWAGKSKLGVDTIFDVSMFLVGKKLTAKIYNAGNFVKSILSNAGYSANEIVIEDASELVDRAFLYLVKKLCDEVTQDFDQYDYSSALQKTEELFWRYCDYYIELVKARAYGQVDCENLVIQKSALAGLVYSLKIFLQLFAPFLPYVTEEVWESMFSENGDNNYQSIHISCWPYDVLSSLCYDDYHKNIIGTVIELLSNVRTAKSAESKSIKHKILFMNIFAKIEDIEIIKLAIKDICAACIVDEQNVTFVEAGDIVSVKCILE